MVYKTLFCSRTAAHKGRHHRKEPSLDRLWGYNEWWTEALPTENSSLQGSRHIVTKKIISAGRLGNNCNENGKKGVHNSALGRVVRKGKDWSRLLGSRKNEQFSQTIKGDIVLVNGGDRWEDSVTWFRPKQNRYRIQNATKDDKSQKRPCCEFGLFLVGVR